MRRNTKRWMARGKYSSRWRREEWRMRRRRVTRSEEEDRIGYQAPAWISRPACRSRRPQLNPQMLFSQERSWRWPPLPERRWFITETIHQNVWPRLHTAHAPKCLPCHHGCPLWGKWQMQQWADILWWYAASGDGLLWVQRRYWWRFITEIRTYYWDKRKIPDKTKDLRLYFLFFFRWHKAILAHVFLTVWISYNRLSSKKGLLSVCRCGFQNLSYQASVLWDQFPVSFFFLFFLRQIPFLILSQVLTLCEVPRDTLCYELALLYINKIKLRIEENRNAPKKAYWEVPDRRHCLI